MEKVDSKEIENKFYQWIDVVYPELIKFDPKFTELQNEKVIFGMTKHMGRLVASAEKIISELQNYQKGKKNMPSHTTFSNLKSSNTG